MKLSFSIKNWNNISWNEFCEVAMDTRMKGIELYDITGSVFKGKASIANPELAQGARRLLNNRGLKLCCLDTKGDFADPDFRDEFSVSVNTAVNLGIEFVSVHTSCTDQAACTEQIGRLLAEVSPTPVTLLVETSGAYADTDILRDLLNRYADDKLAALWDMYETTVTGGEEAEKTITNLGAYVRHVHLHDFRDWNGSIFPELIGEGSLPLESLMNALRSVNYDGFISLVWDPVWMPELTDIEIILTHFASCMGRFGETRRARKHLYWNNQHTGRYVWKKESLIDKTFPQVLDKMVEEFPDQLAIKFTTLDYTRTYSQFRDDVDEFARALISLGVRPGSKVTIWATNVPQWFLTFWAATKIGAILVTMNTAYKIHEAEYLLRQSDTHTLVMIDG